MATEFKLFQNLPPEIRDLIWAEAYNLDTPGIHFILHSDFREHLFIVRLNVGAPTFGWITAARVEMRSRCEATANIAASSREARAVLEQLLTRPGCRIARVPLKTRFHHRLSDRSSNAGVRKVLFDDDRDLVCLRLPRGHSQRNRFMHDLQSHLGDSTQRRVAIEVGPWLLGNEASLHEHKDFRHYYMMACPRHVEVVYLVDSTLRVSADVLRHCGGSGHRVHFEGNGCAFVEVHSGDPFLLASVMGTRHRVEDVLELAETVKTWVFNAREQAKQEKGTLEVRVLATVYYR